MKKHNLIEIHTNWLEIESSDNLKLILAEYRFLVGRFVQWLGLTFGKSSEEQIRQLLLHNLVEECGHIGGPQSHLSSLDDCLASLGILSLIDYIPLQSTRRAEGWFFDTFSNQDCHTCLCVLGPGTETVSQQFLKPLEAAIRQAFTGVTVDYTYFDLHRAEVEAFHALDIDKAIVLIEDGSDPREAERLRRSRQFWTDEAISQHVGFWISLKSHLYP